MAMNRREKEIKEDVEGYWEKRSLWKAF